MERIDPQRDHLGLEQFPPGREVVFNGKPYIVQRRTTLASGERVTFARRHSFKPITTRVYYPGEHAIELPRLCYGHAEPRRAALPVVRAEIRLAQAKIDVARPQPAYQFLQQIQLFHRLVRRRQCGDVIRAVDPLPLVPVTWIDG